MIDHRRRLATGLVVSALTALVLIGGTAAWAEDNSQPQPVYPDQPPATPAPQAQPGAAPAAENGSSAPAVETAAPPEPEGKTQPFAPSAVPSSSRRRKLRTRRPKRAKSPICKVSAMTRSNGQPRPKIMPARDIASSTKSTRRMSASCRWPGSSPSGPTRARKARH